MYFNLLVKPTFLADFLKPKLFWGIKPVSLMASECASTQTAATPARVLRLAEVKVVSHKMAPSGAIFILDAESHHQTPPLPPAF